MGGGFEGVLEGVGEGHALGILGGRDDALGEGVLPGAGEPADQDEVLGRSHGQKGLVTMCQAAVGVGVRLFCS